MKYYFLLLIGTYCFNAYAAHDLRERLIVALLLPQVVIASANQEVKTHTEPKKLLPKYRTKKTQQPRLPKVKRYGGNHSNY